MLLAEESHHGIHHGNLTAHQALCLLWFKMIVWSQVLHSIYPLDDLVFLSQNYHHNHHDLREGFKYHIVFETFPNGTCRHCLILTINSSFLVCKSKREKFFPLRNTWTEVFGDQVALSEQTLFGSFGTYLGYHSREGELEVIVGRLQKLNMIYQTVSNNSLNVQLKTSDTIHAKGVHKNLIKSS